jgi:hypothetical protein
MSGGGSLETRRYAHRSMPHVVGVDFTFDNSKGAVLVFGTAIICALEDPTACLLDICFLTTVTPHMHIMLQH